MGATPAYRRGDTVVTPALPCRGAVIADALEDSYCLNNGQCAGSKLGEYSVCEQVAIFLERGIWAHGLAHNRLKSKDLRAQLRSFP